MVSQVGMLITGTPSAESVCLCWPSSTRDSYPIMTPWQPMAEPSHYLLPVKGRHHQRPQVRYSYYIFILFFLFCTFTFFLCDLKSYFRCWRSNESKADITVENPGLCVCPHRYRHPKEPSDGTIHSWSGQPIYVSHPASTYHSCRTMLAVVGHIAEPTYDEERCEALVRIHRWGGRH